MKVFPSFLFLETSKLIAIVLVIAISVALLLWRWRKKHLLPRSIRRLGVLAAQFLFNVETIISKYHNVVLPVYILIFFALLTGYSSLQQIGSIGKIAVYCFYGLTIFVLIALFIARWLLDPVPKAPTHDYLGALDPVQVQLVPPNSTEEFNHLVDLGEEAFAAWGGNRHERQVVYSKFKQANPESFKLIMRRGMTEPIGFSCVIPVHENAFRQFRLGILDSWDFPPADIVGTTSEYLCLNAIYIRRSSQNEHTRAVNILCNHIAIFVRMNPEQRMPVLVADGLTFQGRRFLKRYGFESCYRTKEKTPIYELDLSRPGLLSNEAGAFHLCLQNALNAEPTAE